MNIIKRIDDYLTENKETVELECMECGKKFKTKNKDLSKVKCPKCKSQDLEVV